MNALLDRLLDHVTMYRLVLYYLVTLIAVALALSIAGVLPFAPQMLVVSTLVAVAACALTNRAFARVFEVPANAESAIITALILVLILDPVGITDVRGLLGIAFASVWAMAAKFVLAVGRRHLFNPAALGVFLSGALLDQPATWWISGHLAFLPVVIAGGLVVVRKLRRFDLVAVYVLANLLAVVATTAPADVASAISETVLSSPLFFFAFVMLTEPLTAPGKRWPRLIFGALVGALSAPNVHVGTFYLTPELALLVGNVLAFALAPQGRFALTLERIEHAAGDAYDFIFRPDRRVAFEAGQYLEWTLALDRSDSRGNRRYFTIASAPTEKRVRLGVKFYPGASAFKRGLAELRPGDRIFAAQVAGDFTLPADPDARIAFIAGGIGITPFRSMLQCLVDKGEVRPIVVLYANERASDICYRDVLAAAERRLGIRTEFAVARDPGPRDHAGYINAQLIRRSIPDFAERIFYVSGPQAMVRAVRDELLRLGVHRSRIKVDFFPGFA
ncbi:MAG: RnfABCDGE type electron transport complex subunit D [Rhizobiales bacterium]|nr:RnfABCDGE type electron transport complex subunit D [Hyphomicrobiales bacterium]